MQFGMRVTWVLLRVAGLTIGIIERVLPDVEFLPDRCRDGDPVVRPVLRRKPGGQRPGPAGPTTDLQLGVEQDDRSRLVDGAHVTLDDEGTRHSSSVAPQLPALGTVALCASAANRTAILGETRQARERRVPAIA
jgi:hypothetical protein